jgi:hypothetical protein
MERGLTRAEWMGAASLSLSALTLAYMAGVQVQQISDLNRRATSLEAVQASNANKIEQLLITTSRIDANVAGLADQARDHRDRRP